MQVIETSKPKAIAINHDAALFMVVEACAFAKISKSGLYSRFRDGSIRAIKRGKRTLIVGDSLRQFINGLPAFASDADGEVR